MRTPASIAGHPIHPILVGIPLGLWLFSLVCDFAGLAAGNDQALWSALAWYTMVGGCIGAALAAIPGMIDLLSLREPRLRRIGVIHAILNTAALVSFAVNAAARSDEIANPGPGLLVLSGVTLFVVIASGWLGGHLVHVHRVGVLEPEVSHRPAEPAPRSTPAAGLAPDRSPGS